MLVFHFNQQKVIKLRKTVLRCQSPSSNLQTSSAHRKRELLKERKQKLINPPRDDENSRRFAATPDQIEIIEKFTIQYLLKNDPTLQQTQAYQIPLPFLIMNIEDLFIEELSSALCALANEEQGGFILIAKKNDSLTIQEGLFNFIEKDEKRLYDLIKGALGLIVSHKYINIRVGGVTLYPSFDAALMKEKSEEFVIKISLCRRPGSNRMFYIEHRVQNFKPTYEFMKIKAIQKSKFKKFSSQKIQQNSIYDLMHKIALQIIKQQITIWKMWIKNSGFEINLNAHLSKIAKLPTKLFLFSADSDHFLVSILQNLAYLGREQINYNFPKVNSQETVIQLQVNTKYDIIDSISKVAGFLHQSKTKYRYVMPLPYFQDALLQFNKASISTIKGYFIVYFFIEELYSNFSTGLRNKMGAEFDQQFIINEVKPKITLSVPIFDYELQAIHNLLWHLFDSIPKVKKAFMEVTNTLNKKKYQGETKINQFIFQKYDYDVAVFSFFYLTLAKKRPL